LLYSLSETEEEVMNFHGSDAIMRESMSSNEPVWVSCLKILGVILVITGAVILSLP
jgi:hypothetical protein